MAEAGSFGPVLSLSSPYEGNRAVQANTPIATSIGEVSETRVSAVVPAILAAVLGVFMIWGVGFSTLSAVHNAAHDVRHSTGFPCH